MNIQNRFKLINFSILISILILGCEYQKDDATLFSNEIGIEYNNNMYSRVVFPKSTKNNVLVDYTPSEFIIIGSDTLKDFTLKTKYFDETDDKIILNLSGIFESAKYKIKKEVTATIDNQYPSIVSTKVKYTNESNNEITINSWVNNSYSLPVTDTSEVVWSYQSGSYEDRPDWVLQISNNFYQKNYMGMNASDYGGGTPVTDVWNKNIGLAVGHLENVPKLVSLPVSRIGNFVNIEINQEKKIILQSGDSLITYETFISIHEGDYFETLSNYSLLMQKRGLVFKEITENAYDPIWCAWGYERDFKVKDILTALPKAKELGFKWAVLDDGWQTAEGDWYLNPKKFPNGDLDMIDFVNKIHEYGLKAKLWWAPLAVDPGTDLYKNNSDLLLINKDGKLQDITWWDSYYLCPAYPGTIEYTKNIVKTIIGKWGYDGLKIDGQHMNAAPPCYNPKHNHKYPEESAEAMPAFYNAIYETVIEIKKNAVVEICPCGDAYSFFMLPYINQPVSSDPTSSWQIRTKGKTIKALMGTSTPYYGDHVELSTGGNDFASTVGVGGVIGTKFTWPVGSHINTESGDVSLTPERELEWKKWIDIYEKNMLPKGEYLGSLYDIGFDRPETHVIRKGDTMYYAFFAASFRGEIELRGLDKNSEYKIYDYIHNKELGIIEAENPILQVDFNKYLLIKVSPNK